jgi:transcriptional regulator with XRE-family HTH domain
VNTAARIKSLRVDTLNVTQRELANKIGVDPITISRWERGETVPSDLHRALLARVCGVHPNWIINGDEVAA